jgi:hypothetical protein
MRLRVDGRRMKGQATVVAIAVIGCSLASQAQFAPPPTVAQTGSPALVLVGHAMRTRLAGIEDLYSVALYAKDPFDERRL